MKNNAAITWLKSVDTVRYIKLGFGNSWFPSCLEHGRLEFGHPDIPHEIAETGNRRAIAERYVELGRSVSKANDFAREVADFFTLDDRCLWITFAQGCLWWAQAKSEVVELPPVEGRATRYRPLVAPWCNLDLNDSVLSVASLSTRLTKVAAYRQTICAVSEADYLLRRIQGIDEPLVAEFKAARNDLTQVVEALVAQLHWRDFEVLCDLIFARSGWQRIGELGGGQKDTDLILQQTATRERAFVQVKSSSTASVLRDYVERFNADPGFDRMFFVCHSPIGSVDVKSRKAVHVWVGEEIAQQVIAAGLLDWLLQKAA